MKLTILGAGGLRTPLIIREMVSRQEQLNLDQLSLMDINPDNLDIIQSLVDPIVHQEKPSFRINWTTKAESALKDADFVITTFRVGGMESRVVDEKVPLKLGLLGQETTGAGGFAMAMRTLPVLVHYVELMKEQCPHAWLINFANPSGLLTEAIIQTAHWKRAVGICDAPSTFQRVAAALLQVPFEKIFLDYFGLNHLGWIRGVEIDGVNFLPQFLKTLQQNGGFGELPFDVDLLTHLQLIPNEYLFYYYYSRQAVENILQSEETRGEWLSRVNRALFTELRQLKQNGDTAAMLQSYQEYLTARSQTYLSKETARQHTLIQLAPQVSEALSNSGYAGVALDLIEALNGNKPRLMTLNIPNHGAIPVMGEEDVVEIPALVQQNDIRPIAVGAIPIHCSSLMQRVKEYEQLTIAAAAEGSRQKALMALTIHPLVNDYSLATTILDQYQQLHSSYFPKLH